MEDVYRITGLTKVYKGSDRKANDRLTFEIRAGEIFGLLGPNGAGKSTLVHQLAGLVRPTAGTIELYGIDIVRRPDVTPEFVALQPQHAHALLDLYPEEALVHTGRFRGLSAAAARRDADDLMEELGLHKLRGRQIRRLSGGQKKLVTLAAAMVGNRPIQIYDEPTNELDPEVRRCVWDKLLSLNRQGTTIVLVTHNVLEAERVIRRVGIINHGRLAALGTPGELKARIDQRVRLELHLKEPTGDLLDRLSALGELSPLGRQAFALLVDRDETRETVDNLLTQVGLDALDDFRILTPSLEDVYLQLGGGV